MRNTCRCLAAIIVAAVLISVGPAALGEGNLGAPEAIEKADEWVLHVAAYAAADEPVAVGVGFAYDSKTIVMEYRVIQNATRVWVTTASGKMYRATQVASADPNAGIAILKLDKASDAVPIPIAQEADIKVTQPVAAVGEYRGKGVASAMGSIVATYVKYGIHFFDYHAALPKNVGCGLVLNDQGSVVGFTVVPHIDGNDTHQAVSANVIKNMINMNIGISLSEMSGWARAQQNGIPIPGDLDITTFVYRNGSLVTGYKIENPADMAGPSRYNAWSGAVLTFRGTAFRQNAASGTANIRDMQLVSMWRAPLGSISSRGQAAGQPAVVKWPKEIREMMNIIEEKKYVIALKEVIYAAQDGSIHFLDLSDGKPTREPIATGLSSHGTVSIDSRGMPLLALGQGTEDSAGMYLYNLIDQKLMWTNKYQDLPGGLGMDGATGSALFDRNTDALISAQENGHLSVVDLNTRFDIIDEKLNLSPDSASQGITVAGRAGNQDAISSGVSMYGHYAYAADAGGVLRCVDVNTMKTVWAMDVDGPTVSALALDMDADGSLALYTGNVVVGDGKAGYCTIRRLNAINGKEEWTYIIKVTPPAGEVGGCIASPVVGQQDIGDLVIFTLSHTKADGQMMAVDKRTGNIVWQHKMDNTVSSPVAVYDDNGKAYIIQGDSKGQLALLGADSGEQLSSIMLNGEITGSPVVYSNFLVIPVESQGKEWLYGVEIR